MRFTVDDILLAVTLYCDINPYSLFSNTRKREIIIPRQIFMTMAKQFTPLSFNRIGKISTNYGRTKALDHATVLHAKKTVLNQLQVGDKVTKNYYEGILEILKNTVYYEIPSIPNDVDLLGICIHNIENYKLSA